MAMCKCGQPAEFTHTCDAAPPVCSSTLPDDVTVSYEHTGTIGCARMPPLNVENDPDRYDYLNANDIIFIREDNGK